MGLLEEALLEGLLFLGCGKVVLVIELEATLDVADMLNQTIAYFAKNALAIVVENAQALHSVQGSLCHMRVGTFGLAARH